MTLSSGGGATSRRRQIDAILAEITGWSAGERMGMFRRWLARSLSIIHLHVLTTLEASGPMPMGKLAESLDVSIASATGIVDRMELRGLVVRRHHPEDRRIILVEPTAKGLAVFDDLDELRRSRIQPILERLTDEELASTLTSLRAVGAARATILEADESVAAGPAGRDAAEPEPR